MLIDGATYTLPDGTPVVARVPFLGSARLDDPAGTPLFIRDGTDGWRVLRYDRATEGYAAAQCDLTDADLRVVTR